MGVSISIIGISTIVFGIGALIISSRARSRLTPGSLRSYIDNFSVCLAFIVIFSIWQTIRSIQGTNINVSGLANYPEYMFIVFAYAAFILTSYKILKISKEFGFKEEGKAIAKIVKPKHEK